VKRELFIRPVKPRNMTIEEKISGHYSGGIALDAIRREVSSIVESTGKITPEDLAPLDEFHTGGREATLHFVAQLGLDASQRVLDIGSGLGGSARLVATQYGCRVSGIDLTPDYCDLARSLAEQVGLTDRVSFRQASALDLPFDDDSFEAAYMIHVGMNIEDKGGVYREAKRVLRSASTFGIYDLLAAPNAHELEFPVPWSRTPQTSFLATIDEMRESLTRAGFEIESEHDRTDFALEFFARLRQQTAGEPRPLGLHLLMGEDFRDKAVNMLENVTKRRCAPWEIVCRRR
jgi:ubiquinone/menaquinone biosynthesis C-methylase UbiE